MKQKRLNDHKLSKVEPPLKRPRGLQKRKQERKIDNFLLSSTPRFENLPMALISEPAIGVKEHVVNKFKYQLLTFFYNFHS